MPTEGNDIDCRIFLDGKCTKFNTLQASNEKLRATLEEYDEAFMHNDASRGQLMEENDRLWNAISKHKTVTQRITREGVGFDRSQDVILWGVLEEIDR
jgi:hypothetical protein